MKVKVSELLGMSDLALRFWADELFKLLPEKKESILILDFSGVEFVSRSFAHEYLKEKSAHLIAIREKNMNSTVKQMFKLASQKPKKNEINISRSKVVNNL
jgi:anti-anti-sigma regulatory factor